MPEPITIHTAGGRRVKLLDVTPAGADGIRWRAEVEGGFECTVYLTGRELNATPLGNVPRAWSSPQILLGVGEAITRALASPPGQQPGVAFHVDVTSSDLHSANAWRPCGLGRSSHDDDINRCLQLDAMVLLANLELQGTQVDTYRKQLAPNLINVGESDATRAALRWELALCDLLVGDVPMSLAGARDSLDLLPPTEMDNVRAALWREWTSQRKS